MDPRAYDWILARWVVARGFVPPNAIQAWLDRCPPGGLTEALMRGGVLAAVHLDAFRREAQAELQKAAGSGIVDPRSRSGPLPTPPSGAMPRPGAAPPTPSGSSLRPSGSGSASRAAGRGGPRLPKAGHHFAGYELEKELGRGGMGAVFRARRSGEKKAVALKLMLSGSEAGERQRARFEREIESLDRLSHPAIVRVRDAGSCEGIDFYAMDYLAGARSLTQFCEDQPMPARVKLLISFARALDHAHENGVIHRDIKPDNLLIDSEGAPWLVDFGLARELDRETRLTRDGGFLGTPGYMAPEQCVSARDADHRADLYALGVILYELLVGRRPFRAEGLTELMAEIMTRKPELPSQIRASVDTRLEQVCLKALAKKPGDRYQSGKAFAEDLERALAGRAVKAGAGARMRRVALFTGGLAALGAALFIGLAALEPSRDPAADYLARAAAWETALDAFERRLRRPEGLPIDEIKRAFPDRPAEPKQGEAWPRAYRVARGRIARIEAESLIRNEQVVAARRRLELAEAWLEGSAAASSLEGLRGLVMARDEGVAPAAALPHLTRALARDRRGDLALCLARVYARLGKDQRALDALMQARDQGFDDRRLEVALLLELGRDEAALDALEGVEGGWRHPKLAGAVERAVVARLQRDPAAGLSMAKATMSRLDERGRRVVIDRLWAALSANLERSRFRDYTDRKRFQELKSFCQAMEELTAPEERPFDVCMRISDCAVNLCTYRGDPDIYAFELSELVCRWRPEEVEFWLRLTDETLWKGVKIPVRDRILDKVSLALESVKTPKQRLILLSHFAHLACENGKYQRGIDLLPLADAETRASSAADSGELDYWTMKCYKRLGRYKEALERGEIGLRTGAGRRTDYYRGMADTLVNLGRGREAFEYSLKAVTFLAEGDRRSEWRERVNEALFRLPAGEERAAESLAAHLDEAGRPLLASLVRVWIAMRCGERARAQELLEGFAAEARNDVARRRAAALKEALGDAAPIKRCEKLWRRCLAEA